MKGNNTLQTEQGMILVIVMLLLLLLTIMGAGAIATSSIEMGIAGNDRLSKKAFCTAEAGLAHVTEQLQFEFANRNRAKVASGQIPDWDFAINGVVPGIHAADDTNFNGGAVWVKDQALAGDERLPFVYTVVVWNNPIDPGGITHDTDRLLHIRSVATGPKRSACHIETVLLSQISGNAVAGYFAQSGAGSGGGNTNGDVQAISNFTVQ